MDLRSPRRAKRSSVGQLIMEQQAASKKIHANLAQCVEVFSGTLVCVCVGMPHSLDSAAGCVGIGREVLLYMKLSYKDRLASFSSPVVKNCGQNRLNAARQDAC